MKNTNKVSIKTISIKHFRSITSVNISADKLNIFVGLNDVGKSNILKALNLFFNGETDYNQGFVFEKDFSKLFPEKNKKAKEIEIKITFDIPKNYKDSGEYIWTKSWRQQGIVKDEIASKQGGTIPSRSKIPNLLKKITFRYVPAVKSSDYYNFLLIELYKAVSSAVDSPLKIASNEFSQTLRKYTSSLSKLLLEHIDLKSELSLPENFSEIFEMLMFNTQNTDSNIQIPLQLRGDGIQVRHIPIILKYIADEDYKKLNSRGAVKITTIWGFEEPENGLELRKAFEMADEFYGYSNDIQIFVTTHSPAFYSKKEEVGVKILFVKKNPETKNTIAATSPDIKFINESLGLMPIVAPYIAEKNKQICQIKELWKNEPLIDEPTIMVEGITDKKYLEMAIDSLSINLKSKLENNELRIITREKNGAGTTLIKNLVFAWLHSGNKSKMMAIFDRDEAGKSAIDSIKEYRPYQEQNNKTHVIAVPLEPSDNIINLYKVNFNIQYEIEHLLSIETWEKAIRKKYVSARTSKELLISCNRNLKRNESIDSIMEEKISNEKIRETIANYNPHKDKKAQFCDMVEKLYEKQEIKNIFDGFQKTIIKIEDYFDK